ncbi:MAG TPA: ABC transporter permease [Sphingobium sp.]
MTDTPLPQPPSPDHTGLILNEPGVAVIRSVNWAGTQALYRKEVRRFMKVQLQTIWGPSVTTLLYLLIFVLALGGAKREVLGVPFPDFVAPGLIAMAMIQATFANASFSLLNGKMQGTIVDYLMPPLSTGELILALAGASVTRAILVGLALWMVMALWPGVHVTPRHFWAVAWFGLLGATFVAFIGILSSVWAEKFDHSAAVTNFVIGPLSLLSGTFYAIDRLPPLFHAISHLNPFFYIISGFRYGFLSAADTEIVRAAIILLIVTTMAGGLAYAVLRSGWRIKP